jgi:sporulation protein YlmC with PRC-barrel domain
MDSANPKEFVTTKDIEGTSVRNLQDENVGTIKNIMLYSDTGEVAYAVLSVSTGFLNMDSKYFAIPWEALSFTRAQSSGEDIITLDVSKERLEDDNAPGFDKDNWPAGPQTEFITSIHHYYGTTSRRRPL